MLLPHSRVINKYKYIYEFVLVKEITCDVFHRYLKSQHMYVIIMGCTYLKYMYIVLVLLINIAYRSGLYSPCSVLLVFQFQDVQKFKQQMLLPHSRVIKYVHEVVLIIANNM